MATMLLDAWWRLARPLLFRLDAEDAHRRVVGGLGRVEAVAAPVLGLLAGRPAARQPIDLAGIRLANPVGLAAGMDKDGEAIGIWPALGFGFVELGTVTAHPQPGNPRPRLFRLVDERGLINRMGFNNRGSAALAERLQAWRASGPANRVPVGANIGKSKVTPLEDATADYLLSVGRLKGLADWITVNVSSPNTPGLRTLQQAEPLRKLLDAVVPAALPTPIFLKLAPDLADEDTTQAVEIAVESGCAAVVATNTTNTRPGTTGRTGEQGGLSGAPLWPLARQRIERVVEASRGRVAVIGVGGLSTAEQARELLGLGCVAVQLYTALVYEGPGLARRLERALATSGGVQC